MTCITRKAEPIPVGLAIFTLAFGLFVLACLIIVGLAYSDVVGR